MAQVYLYTGNWICRSRHIRVFIHQPTPGQMFFTYRAVAPAYQDCHFKRCPNLVDFTAMLGHITRVDIVVNIQQTKLPSSIFQTFPDTLIKLWYKIPSSMCLLLQSFSPFTGYLALRRQMIPHVFYCKHVNNRAYFSSLPFSFSVLSEHFWAMSVFAVKSPPCRGCSPSINL